MPPERISSAYLVAADNGDVNNGQHVTLKVIGDLLLVLLMFIAAVLLSYFAFVKLFCSFATTRGSNDAKYLINTNLIPLWHIFIR